LVRLCEVFAFRVYRLLERRSDAGQKTIFRVAHELFDRSIDVDEAMRQLRSELLGYCPNHAFHRKFKLSEEENNGINESALKYLLFEYEEHLAKGKTIQPSWNAIVKRPIEQNDRAYPAANPD